MPVAGHLSVLLLPGKNRLKPRVLNPWFTLEISSRELNIFVIGASQTSFTVAVKPLGE